MILIDYNQVLISNIMSQINSNPNAELNENLIRHMVLSSVLYYKNRFGGLYGEMVFCCDNRNYWRKDYFKYYKAGRKKQRDKSGFDWILIFDTLDKMKQELRENFPYKVIEVDGAEADDIVATLVKESQAMIPREKVLILSSDKDFMQLQRFDNVFQYSPIMKKMLHTDDPRGYLYEHILRGDAGDGIPNIKSDDNIFLVEGKRQKSVRSAWVDECIDTIKKEGLEDFLKEQTEDFRIKWARNQQLVDLEFTPEDIKKEIVSEFEKEPKGARRKLLTYFIKHRLKNLMEKMSEF